MYQFMRHSRAFEFPAIQLHETEPQGLMTVRLLLTARHTTCMRRREHS